MFYLSQIAAKMQEIKSMIYTDEFII